MKKRPDEKTAPDRNDRTRLILFVLKTLDLPVVHHVHFVKTFRATDRMPCYVVAFILRFVPMEYEYATASVAFRAVQISL